MTIREGIFTVKRLFREVNADSRLPNKLVYSLLLKHSKWLVYRDSEKLKLLKRHKIYQTQKCIKVIEAPSVDSCCGIKSKNCTIYRTENKIPEMYEDSAGVIIHNITSVDAQKSTDIEMRTISAIRRLLQNPWAKKTSKGKIYAFYNDGYVYFPFKHLKMVQIEAFFIKKLEETDCEPCKDCDKKPCPKFLDSELVIPDYLEAQMVDYVLKDLASTYQRIPEKSIDINKNDNLK